MLRLDLLLRILGLGDDEFADLSPLFQVRVGMVDRLGKVPEHRHEFACGRAEMKSPNPALERPQHGHVAKSHIVGDDHRTGE